jgi:hypothetical protein
MEDIVIANPIDPSVSGGAVANSPPKAPIPPIRERILGPSSQYPLVKNVLVKTAISRPTQNRDFSIDAELASLRKAWEQYRSTNSRDAVYIYLKSFLRLSRDGGSLTAR